MNLIWDYHKAGHGQTIGFAGNGIEEFTDDIYGNLAREAIQNSLDAKEAGGTVVVEFSFFKTDKSDFPSRDSFIDYLRKWQESKRLSSGFTRDADDWKFFDNALSFIGGTGEMGWLRISDHHTTGMRGCSDEANQDTAWYAFTKAIGQNTKDPLSGGSKGLGKNAFFAASLIRAIIVSTYSDKKEIASQGIAKLGSFRLNDGSSNPDNTQGVVYCVENSEKARQFFSPIPERLRIDSSFERAEGDFGSDIYIPCFEADPIWENAILGEAMLSFLPAILDKELEIRMSTPDKSVAIDSSNISSEIKNKNNYLSGKKKMMNEAKSYFNVLTSPNTKSFSYNSSKPGFEMSLLVLEDGYTPTNAILAFRLPTKMRIKELHPQCYTDYSGVLLIKGVEICKRLRAIENATHSKWSRAAASSTKFTKEEIAEALDAVKSFTDEKLSSFGINDGKTDADFNWAKNQGWSTDENEDDLLAPTEKDEGLPTEETTFDGDSDSATHKKRKPLKKGGTVEVEDGDAEAFFPGTGTPSENGVDEGSHPQGHNNGGGGDPHPGEEVNSIDSGEEPMMVRKPIATAQCKMPAINPEAGFLALIFSPNKSGTEAQISIMKLGADGSNEPTIIFSASNDGVPLEVDGSTIKMERIEKGKHYRIELHIDENKNYVWEVNISANE